MDRELYDEMWQTEQSHWWFVARRRIVGNLIERFLGPTKDQRLRICELGCGTGGNIAAFGERHDVIGVDASEHALEFARRRLGDRVHSGRLPDQIPLPRNQYDVVLLTDVFEHVEQDHAAAVTALDLVRPNGLLVATVPAYQWLYSPRDAKHHHFRRYSKQRFVELFARPGIRLELLSFYNTFLFPFAAAARLWSMVLPVKEKELRVPAAPVNWLLKRIFMLEGPLLGRVGLPFGLSLIAVARKTSTENDGGVASTPTHAQVA